MRLSRLFQHLTQAAMFSGGILLAQVPDVEAASLAKQDIIDVQPDMSDPQKQTLEFDPANRDRLIRFRHIIETGKIALYPEELTDYSSMNLSVDLDKNDAYTQALDRVLDAVLEETNQSAVIQNLLSKQHWDKNDRVEWEKNLAKIVSEQAFTIEAFQEYRSDFDFSRDDIIRLRYLNGLSEDIESPIKKYEFDCEQMAATEGIILQKAEDTILGAESDGYKSNGDYYYASGKKMYHFSQRKGGHAFIISSITGNIIEATSNPVNAKANKATPENENYTAYHEASPLSPSQNFDDFAHDRLFIAKDGSAAYQVYMNFDNALRLMEQTAARSDSAPGNTRTLLPSTSIDLRP